MEEMLADVPRFYSTPEIRVACPDDDHRPFAVNSQNLLELHL